MEEIQQEWLKSFENKTEAELYRMRPPPDLTDELEELWQYDRGGVLLELDRQKAAARKTEKMASLEATMAALESRAAGTQAPFAPTVPLEIPKGNAADLLERQIGTCAALIGNLADYIARNDTPTDVCFPFMDRISSLVSSSATAARVVGQLRGIASETRQTFITEKGGTGAGGVPQT